MLGMGCSPLSACCRHRRRRCVVSSTMRKNQHVLKMVFVQYMVAIVLLVKEINVQFNRITCKLKNTKTTKGQQ